MSEHFSRSDALFVAFVIICIIAFSAMSWITLGGSASSLTLIAFIFSISSYTLWNEYGNAFKKEK